MEVRRIEPQHVYGLAEAVWPLLEKACEASQETPESALVLCENAQADLWVAAEDKTLLGVCVSQVVQKPKGTMLNILALGGEDGGRWLRRGFEELKRDARELGATKITIIRLTGRKAFMGHKPTGYYYEGSI